MANTKLYFDGLADWSRAAFEEAMGAAVAAVHTPFTAWERFDHKARREETSYRMVALALFRRERESIAARIERAASQFKAAADPHPTLTDPYVEAALLLAAADYAPGGAYHEAWLRRYRELISRTIALGGSSVAASIGLRFNLKNPRAIDAINRRVNRLTGNVTQTSLQRVREIVAAARLEGVGVSEIAKRIRQDAFGSEISLSRATTIARTETVGALNEGQHLAATEGGVMRAKRWLSQGDGRVRPDHVDADAQGWIAMSEPFTNGLQYPHEAGAPADQVINCRCAALYSDQLPAEANRGSP
jgi:hypothetical protein